MQKKFLNSLNLHNARLRLRVCRQSSIFKRRDDLDQCYATIKTVLARLKLLFNSGDLLNKRVLMLGDDDLFSVAISASGLLSETVVIDIDLALLRNIVRFAFDVKCIHHDLHESLPPYLNQSFDVIFTDPPYTLTGQLLFIKRAIQALRPDPKSSFYLCASRFYLTQTKINELVKRARISGIELKNIIENFNEYDPPPDVVEDLKKRENIEKTNLLTSSLFCFKPFSRLFPELIQEPVGSNIYNYHEDENGAA